MLLGRSFELQTPRAPGETLDRLSALVLPTEAIVPLRPVRVKTWIAQHAGSRFVGRVEDSRFNLGLLNTSGARFRVSGSVVVIEGRVEGHMVHVNLRPPLFVSVFLALFTLFMSAVLVLSFFGPSSGSVVRLLLALPTVVVAAFFGREATLAEQTLRQVLQAN